MIFFDLKIFEPGAHKKFTGVDNKVIQKNAEDLQKSGYPVHFRIPLIQEITDTEENILSFVAFFKKLNINKVSLLKFHNLYESKLGSLGRHSEKTGLPSYPTIKFQQITNLFEENNIHIVA